ncbi:MAG: type IV secretory system conjugative DNA transfer family protein [Phormidium tanganyikae FI6-MK23]|jgi:hypothetical protein|nr:type IV secretory system conjugative DNA transfer family protein [Phormidium tanganyikae FI6-MK23]
MSQLAKHSEHRIIWTIGNTQIVEDAAPDQGIVPLVKVAMLGIGAISVASVSPVIAISLAGYAGMKIFDLATSVGKDGADIAKNIYDEVNGVEVETVPEHWAKMPQLPEESQPVRIVTQLGEQSAIDIPAQPVTSWQNSSTQAAIDHTQQMKAVCDRNNSFYIAGSKGSGKGTFAANLLRWKLEQYPNAIALILDPKGDLKESGYWQHDRIKHYSFKGIALSSEAYQSKIALFLEEARNLVSQADVARGMRLFIVLDELLTVKESINPQLFAEFRRFGVSAISTGDSEGVHLVAITQSFNASDSFGSDELLKNFTTVGLFRKDEYQRAKKLIQYGRSNADSLTSTEFNQLIDKSPVERVMSIAGEFIPTPKLENHASYDRDSGKVIRQNPVGRNPSEGDLLAEQLKTEVAKLTVPTAQVEPQSLDLFEQFAALLTHESQSELKSFVLWLRDRKGQEISFEQIKDNWAKRANVKRNRETIDPFIQMAILQRLIEPLTNTNWLVRDV